MDPFAPSELAVWIRYLEVLAWSQSAKALELIGIAHVNSSAIRTAARRMLDEIDGHHLDDRTTIDRIWTALGAVDQGLHIRNAVSMFLLPKRLHDQAFEWSMFFKSLGRSDDPPACPLALAPIVAIGQEAFAATRAASDLEDGALDDWDLQREHDHPDHVPPSTDLWSAILIRAYVAVLSAVWSLLGPPSAGSALVAWARSETALRGWTDIEIPELPDDLPMTVRPRIVN